MKKNSSSKGKDQWGSRLGIVLAMAGSAVGFGNFLRFPGLAAQYGGGAFMVAYFVSLLLLGMPVGFAEWTLGRRGGMRGGHTMSSILWLITHNKWLKYLGLVGVLSVTGLSTYYIFIEAWTFAYAYDYVTGQVSCVTSEEFQALFARISGVNENGAAFSSEGWAWGGMLIPLVVALTVNFYLLYRGIRAGIEMFCKWSMPALILICLLMVARVLTLGTPNADMPERNVMAGLTYMWEPSRAIVEERVWEESPQTKEREKHGGDENAVSKVETWKALHVCSLNDPKALAQLEAEVASSGGNLRLTEISMWDELRRPSVWLAAAGQIFFSLSVGFGMILTYASYVRRREDLTLTSLSSFMANEFCEVGIGGMMTVPAAVAFLGLAGAAGQATFALAFNVLPQVFAQMPAGGFFGALFFLLLAIAAVTSSLSMMQPCLAFLEESLNLSRKQAVVLFVFVMTSGVFVTSWFTEGLLAIDIFDFFAGNIAPLMIAVMLLLVFNLYWGVNTGYKEFHRGSIIQVPRAFKWVTKYISPVILAAILLSVLAENIFYEVSPKLLAIWEGKPGAVLPMVWMMGLYIFLAFIAHTSNRFNNRF